MPPDPSNELRVFVLNVGQADTSVIVTPQGRVVVIDAVKRSKLTPFLGDLGLQQNEDIEHLIITHPHDDHYIAAEPLLHRYNVREVTLAPCWAGDTDLTFCSGYHSLVNEIETKDVPCRFVSGYERIYPDQGTYAGMADEPMIELVGPSNSVLANIDKAHKLNENHLSVMARLTWRSFVMVFAADAQMENWAHFDREGMLKGGCNVLKAAHHGSMNGTQWERLDRLEPETVIVSSDLDGQDDLPDLIGSAILYQYAQKHLVALTDVENGTGTVKITSTGSSRPTISCFGEGRNTNVPWADETGLPRGSKPTNWNALVQQRMAG